MIRQPDDGQRTHSDPLDSMLWLTLRRPLTRAQLEYRVGDLGRAGRHGSAPVPVQGSDLLPKPYVPELPRARYRNSVIQRRSPLDTTERHWLAPLITGDIGPATPLKDAPKVRQARKPARRITRDN